ncbi:MAG: metallophosphoesterase family protein [Actinobacteria bacterium]|nr:metallophosphoesterase family protein [Actinomycetota bacterium]
MSGGVLLGIVSDTHLFHSPLPERVLEVLQGADLILHAGDILEMAVLEKLETIAPVTAVAGNMDHGEVTEVLPGKRVLEIAGKRIGLIHGSGPPAQITDRLRGEFEDVDAIVFGHTHQAYNRSEGGVYFFNPGSPTDKMFAPYRSLGFLEVSEGLRGRIVMLE